MHFRDCLAVLAALASATLAPVAAADEAAAERNLDKLNLPPGFEIEVYAEVPGARQMAFGQSTGTVFVGTRGKKAYAVVDRDKDRKADAVHVILEDLKMGNGVAMHQGYLYVAEQHRIARYPAPGFELDLPFEDMREVIYEELPDKFHHGWRYLGFGPDGKLYVTVGVPCNICEPEGVEGTILRMDPDGANAGVYAEGIRNSVGLAFHPASGELYFTDNNTDNMGDDRPPGELNHAPKAGLHFGFPYYAGGRERHADWAEREPPREVSFPVVEFQAHTAPLGISFYTGSAFPAEYAGDAFLAQHGSWNRSTPVGYRVMRIRFDEQGEVAGKEVFADGWLQQGEAWGRPVDTLELPDGSLLVSDDYQGVIYRISYTADAGAGEAGTTAAARAEGGGRTPPRTVTGLQNPESAVAHPDGRVFVTEIGAFGTDGDGKVTEISPDGATRTLAGGLDDPKGMDLWNGALYVADKQRLLRIGLDGEVGVLAAAADFPGTPRFLNDVEVDGEGTVYVSDSGSDTGADSAVYRVTQDGKVTAPVTTGSHPGLKRPNGLLLDGPQRLIVGDYAEGTLYRLDLAAGRLTALNNGFGGTDGLVRDPRGYLYVSDWKGGRVLMLSEPRATPQLVADDFEAAADMGLAADGRHLLVPDMKAGTLRYLPLP